jgi:hypothetical protein
MSFDAATHPNAVLVSDLIDRGMKMEIHCNRCARYRLVSPADLPLPPETPVPSLAGAFKCTRCGSRQTEARPHYTRD